MTEDDFYYAMENTRIVLSPRKRLETFGTTIVNYYLITEEMDHVDQSWVREGTIHAERPQIITPNQMSRLALDGFGDEAEHFAEWINRNLQKMMFLKYGFCIRKAEISSYHVQDRLEAVVNRVREQVEAKDDPLSVVATGLDDTWEVSLLKVMIDVIQDSSGYHIREFKQRGLL